MEERGSVARDLAVRQADILAYRGHLREKDRCPGCNGDDALKPRHCVTCRIKNCEEIKTRTGSLCFECARFSCARLRRLDGRYRAKYGMSMVENLESIRTSGLAGFLALEKERWKCAVCGAVLCVHRERCLYCGHLWRSSLGEMSSRS